MNKIVMTSKQVRVLFLQSAILILIGFMFLVINYIVYNLFIESKYSVDTYRLAWIHYICIPSAVITFMIANKIIPDFDKIEMTD